MPPTKEGVSELLQNFQISPLIVSHEKEEDRETITFYDGCVAKFTKDVNNKNYREGERLFSNGTLETGKFLAPYDFDKHSSYVFENGTRTSKNGVEYLISVFGNYPKQAEDGTKWIHQLLDNGTYRDLKVISAKNSFFVCVEGKRELAFVPYQIECNRLNVKKVITTREEEIEYLAQCKEYINSSHCALELRKEWASEKGQADGLSYRRGSAFISLLEGDFEVKRNSFSNIITLEPKIKEKSEKNGIITIHYQNGVEFVYKMQKGGPLSQDFYKGTRKFPDGIIEKGKFHSDGNRSFFHGRRTDRLGKTVYVTTNPFEFDKEHLWTLMQLKDETGRKTWQVLRRESPEGEYPAQYVLAPSKKPLDLIMNSLDGRGGRTLIALYEKQMLSDEEMHQILPLLFKKSEPSTPPVIFQYDFHAILFVLEKAKKLNIPLNLSITYKDKNGKTEPFFMHWVKKLGGSYGFTSSSDNPESVHKYGVKELTDLFESMGPNLLEQYIEHIFLTLVDYKSPILERFDFSSYTFSPYGVFMRNLLGNKADLAVCLEQFQLCNDAEKNRAIRIANYYQKTLFLETVNKLEHRPWEKRLPVKDKIPGNPVQGSPALISAEMSLSERKQAGYQFLKALKHRGLLLTEREFKKRDPSAYISKGGDIGRILGRDYLEYSIDHLRFDKVKVPKKYAVLKEGKTAVNLRVDSYGAAYADDVEVYAEKVPEVKRAPTLDEIQQVILIFEATGYSDRIQGNILIGVDGLYIVDTEYDCFKAKPAYHLIQDLVNCLENEEDKKKAREFLVNRINAYKVCAAQVEEVEERWKNGQSDSIDLYGSHHTFTYKLDELKKT